MQVILEFLMEIVLEGSLYIAGNKKISKWIRYPIIGIIVLFFGAVIFGIGFFGVIIFEKSKLLSFFLLGISMLFLYFSVKKGKQFLERERQ